MLKKDSLINLSGISKLKGAIIFSVCYLILELILASFHEMWRDEIQAWSITFNSHSLSELFYLSRHEGHGKLWYLILYFLQIFHCSIYYMKLIHVLIATFFVFIFYYFSPFKTIEKILICFGYYFFYEYAVISRDYSIELLFLFLCLSIYLKYRERYLILNSVLFLILFQTNIYAIIIGIPLYIYVISDLLKAKSISKKTFFKSLIIVVSGLIISIYFLIPPDDQGMAGSWIFRFDSAIFIDLLTRIYTGYFPFPQLKIEFWNTNFIDSFDNFQLIQIILSFLSLICITLIFRRKIKIMLLFYSGTFGLLIFTYIKYFGYQRHHGQLFILFVLCLWIYLSELKSLPSSTKQNFNALLKYFILLLIIVNFSATGVATYYEINYPFSNAAAAGEYLKSNSLDTMNIAGDEYPASSISGLLNKEIYFPQSKRFSIFVVFDNKWHWLPTQGIIDEANNHFKTLNENYLLILTFPIDSIPSNWQFLKGFDNSIVGDENYYIYQVNTK